MIGSTFPGFQAFFLFFSPTIVGESLFNKVAGLKVCNFIKKRIQHKCFPLNIANFLRTPVLKNICERLLLKIALDFWNRGHHEHFWSTGIKSSKQSTSPAGIYLFKANDGNTRRTCEIFLKLTIKTPERRY